MKLFDNEMLKKNKVKENKEKNNKNKNKSKSKKINFKRHKQGTVVINKSKVDNKREKIIAIILEILILVFSLIFILKTNYVNDKFLKSVNEFSDLNAKTVFSIKKTQFYSSATAKSNSERKAMWNLDITQYTDMAFFINNHSEDGKITNENTIKKLYIDNIKFEDFDKGHQSLYYKNINDFAKYDEIEGNKIHNRLDYKVINEGEVNFTQPQIYADGANPITLEFVNKNVKEKQIISDISKPMVYNGTLLRRGSVLINDIKGKISFRINIVNNYDQLFRADVYFEVPLENVDTGKTIYDGKFEKKEQKENLIRFYRVK